MFSFLAKPFGLALYGLYQLVGRYWLSIAILSLLIRLALYPIYKKQVVSTANLTDIQPKIREIQSKYASDKEMQNRKIAELYKAENFNPMMGCLPMIVQLIVISGLFVLLRNPLHFMSEDMVFAVHESFLWVSDLSQPDPWILPILCGLGTYFGFSMSSMTQQGGGSQGGSKFMKYAFPIMFIWLTRTYPAGLAIYWFISQLVQVFFNIRFNKLRKELKAVKIIEERREKKKYA
jgi:YidC/Oxa1 family membrane protein insertase